MLGTGYIVEKYNNMNFAYTSTRLIEEAKRCGISLKTIGVADTVEINGILYNKGKKLEKADIVINLYKYGNIKDKLASYGGVSVNAIDKINRYIDKSNQISDLKVPMPKSMLALYGIDFEYIVASVGLPFVAKGLCGSQGNQVYLINNAEEYKKLSAFVNTEMLFQQYIAESCGKDIRFLAVKGEPVACMMRSAKSGFKANFALGAEVSEYPVDNEIKNFSREIFNALSIDILGIDLLMGRDGYMFCEVNVTPGIEGVEKATKKNIAREIIDFTREQVYNNANKKADGS